MAVDKPAGEEQVDNQRDPLTGHKLTGHEWNGIVEINTAVPRPYWMFLIAAFLFSVGYWILMPAWPLGKTYTKGLLGVDQHNIVETRVKEAVKARAKWTDQIVSLDFADIAARPELMEFVRQDGHRLFGDNCAACHGVEATGNSGFGAPDLVDHDWLWGGDPDTVFQTITVGVNSHKSDETRSAAMPAWGKDAMLDRPSVVAVANYVKSLSDPAWGKGKQALLAKGQQVFADNCAACHGADARGSHDTGAPNLTDNIWLYGGDINSIYTSIWGGREGEMPAWGHRLTDLERKILTLFVLDKGHNPITASAPAAADAGTGGGGSAT